MPALAFISIAIAAAPFPGVPQSLPEGTRDMIETALADGDTQTIEAVLRLARKTSPGAKQAIDALEEPWRAQLALAAAEDERRKQEALANASFIEGWTGAVELGASRSTGSTDSFGLYGSLVGERVGLQWTHKVGARADVQKTNDVTTTERLLASWQPNYRVSDRFYAYGLAQYEYDPILGYDARYTASGGIGFGLVRTSNFKLDFEGGPALRFTDQVEGGSTSTISGRGSVNLNWKIGDRLEVRQAGSFYFEPGDSSASSLTALDTKLIGDLKARLSYNVLYEEARPLGVEAVDTSSRATLIYSF